jgi:D-alanyl-D-alanine carboxypeptidase
MKKLKLKKKAKIAIIVIILFIVLIVFGTNTAVKAYKQKQYEKTYEYKLITLGYSKEDANLLEKKLKDKELKYILENKKDKIYIDLLKEKYFIYDYYYKYIDYYNAHLDTNLTKVIEIINTNRDKEYYTDPIKTDYSKKELMLVNKYYHLDNDYTPEDLVTIPTTYAYGDYGSQKVTKSTYDAYVNLWNASHENGYYLMVSSSYRPYERQEIVYNDYQKSKGTEYADSIAARPGFSEHQTGYALDVFEKGTTQKTFQNSESYKWLKENAHNYGFILRYPEDKENITGYSFESWHIRYVGNEAAKIIYENNISFDEYYAYYVK